MTGFVESSPAGIQLLFLTLLIGGCARAVAESEAAGGEMVPAEGMALVFRCDGDQRFIVRGGRDSVRVTRDLFEATLARDDAAPGVRYTDSNTTLRSHGAEAWLETGADTLTGCRGTVAADPWEVSRLLGYTLRAIGQEPGWVVEIAPDGPMRVLADYGTVAFLAGPPVVSTAGGGTVYRARGPGGVDVAVTVTGRRCEDVMSGEAFPLTVSLQIAEREHTGCGRRLEPSTAVAGRDGAGG